MVADFDYNSSHAPTDSEGAVIVVIVASLKIGFLLVTVYIDVDLDGGSNSC